MPYGSAAHRAAQRNAVAASAGARPTRKESGLAFARRRRDENRARFDVLYPGEAAHPGDAYPLDGRDEDTCRPQASQKL